MDALKQRLKSKTYWAAIIMGLLGVLEQQYALIAQFVPPQYQSMMPLLFPLVMMGLRELTTNALSEK
jgi:uncharacterized membrane protein